MRDELSERRFRKQHPGALEFDCELPSCPGRNFIAKLNVTPLPNESLIKAVEDEATRQHFLGTGCYGHVRIRRPGK